MTTTTTTTTDRLERRIRELEVARSRDRIATVVVLALLAAIACRPSTVQSPGATPAATPAAGNVVRVASADGQREAQLTPDGLFLKVGGKERARLIVTPDGANVALAMRDSSGAGRLALQASDGPVGLSLLDHTGHDAVVVAADESDAAARVELFGAQHVLAAVADSRASLSLSSADGHSLWHAP